MMLALNAAVTMARNQPRITLSTDKDLRYRLRPFRKHGLLLMATIKDEVQLKLRKHLADEPRGLISQTGDFDLIVDTGCTKTGTGFQTDFIPGTLQNLPSPIQMDGIAGGMHIAQEGQVKYEIVDDTGKVQEIIVDAYLIPQLRCRLFSPQAYFQQQFRSGHNPDEVCSMVVKHDKTVVTLANDSKIAAHYDKQTFLPRIHARGKRTSQFSYVGLSGVRSNPEIERRTKNSEMGTKVTSWPICWQFPA
jgi:hypothetical protein